MLLSSVLNLPAGSQEDSEPQGELDLENDKSKMLIEVEMLKHASRSRYVDNCFEIKDFEQTKDFDSVKLTPT